MPINTKYPELFSVAIKESDNSAEIDADVTGFSRDSIVVSAWQNYLLIDLNAEMQEPESYYLGDAEVERFRRAIPLSFNISEADISTQCRGDKLYVKITSPGTTDVRHKLNKELSPA